MCGLETEDKNNEAIRTENEPDYVSTSFTGNEVQFLLGKAFLPTRLTGYACPPWSPIHHWLSKLHMGTRGNVRGQKPMGGRKW